MFGFSALKSIKWKLRNNMWILYPVILKGLIGRVDMEEHSSLESADEDPNGDDEDDEKSMNWREIYKLRLSMSGWGGMDVEFET